MNIILTKSTTPIIGWIAELLGYIISGIYWCLEKIGFPNIGVSIILFTFVMYLLMTPLQIKQQKFSKMNSIMQPEIQKIQEKYKNKKDQASQQKMQEETQAVYEKYGVSPTGSCVQMCITLPVMFALYQVIYRIPGYITSVKEIFTGLVDQIIAVDGYTEIIQTLIDDLNISNITLTTEDGLATSNSVIDFLYKLNTSQWGDLAEVSDFSGFTDVINSTRDSIQNVSVFLGLNISDTPFVLIKEGVSTGKYLLVFAAILIPVLAWFTQWMNYKMMPTNSTSTNGEVSAADASMKSMSTVMPLMSAFFCVTFPVGIGLYWIAGALFRSVQQVLINKHLNKIDVEDIIKQNQEKAQKKREKEGYTPQKITEQASRNARRVNEIGKGTSSREKEEALKKAEEYYRSDQVKEGSIAAKANMVRKYDEKNKSEKKKKK